jgi:hypothetical protein
MYDYLLPRQSLISNVYLIIVIRLHDQIHTGGQCRSFSFSVRRNLTQYIGTTVLPRATVAHIVRPRLLEITYHQLFVVNLFLHGPGVCQVD